MGSIAVAFSVAFLTGPFYLALFCKGDFHKLLRGDYLTNAFSQCLFSCAFALSFFRALCYEGFFRALFRRNLLSSPFCSGIFLALFRKCFFRGLFLRGDSFLFRGSVLPCSLSQRRYPWAHPLELFPCASLQWFFPCSLWQGRLPCDSSHAFLRALFLRAFIPRTPLQHRFPWAQQRLIFRTLLCSDFLRALFRLRFFRAIFCRDIFPAFFRIGFSVSLFAWARSCSFLLPFFQVIFPWAFL